MPFNVGGNSKQAFLQERYSGDDDFCRGAGRWLEFKQVKKEWEGDPDELISTRAIMGAQRKHSV